VINILGLMVLYIGIGLPIYLMLEDEQWNWQKRIGESFFLGIFFVIVLLNLVQLTNLNMNMTAVFYGLSIVSVISILVYIYINKEKISTAKVLKVLAVHNIFYVFTSLLILLQLYNIIQQNQSLPLVPWDSWNGWVAKAKIWFYHGINEPLIGRIGWLKVESMFTNSTVDYPDGLPLLYLFNSGNFGWDETQLNALYPAMFMAFLLGFYGNIKLLTHSKNLAWVGTVMLITIPLIITHVTLAGYADIWVAEYLALTIFSAQHSLSKLTIKSLILVVIFASAMILFKLESWVWLAIFFIALSLALISKVKRQWIYVSIVLFVIIMYFTGGLSITLPIGEIVFKPSLIKIPGLGSFSLSYVDTTAVWLDALFYSKNWNLLWYTIPFVVYFATKLKDKTLVILPGLFMVFASLFIFILFYFTYASIFANDFTSSNRIVLQIVPVYIYLIVQVINQIRLQKV